MGFVKYGDKIQLCIQVSDYTRATNESWDLLLYLFACLSKYRVWYVK